MSDSGVYSKHFRSGGIIAIGHLDEVYENDAPDEVPTEEFIKARMLKSDKYSEFRKDKDGKESRQLKRSALRTLGQIKRFANDIKCGDLIVTRDEHNSGYSFGVCCDTAPYIDKNPVRLTLKKKDGSTGFDDVSLNYTLRKRVVWGASVPRSELPGAVKRATSGHQTVTSLNLHKEKIYHLIYPFFTDGESLYFSNKIKTRAPINALAVGKLFQNVALVKKLADALVEGDHVSLDDLIEVLEKEALFSDGSAVTCQAAFMSPGDMWCRIPISHAELLNYLYACVIASLLVTGQVEASEIINSIGDGASPMLVENKEGIFNDKFKPAVVSPRLRAIAQGAGALAEQVEQKNGNSHSIVEVNRNLELGLPEVDTTGLENFSFGISVLEIKVRHEDH